jgi:hypothetical protein
MRKEFKKWLIEIKNLPEFSPSGSRSTAPDYAWRISKILRIENLCWDDMLTEVHVILPQYERGDKRAFGKEGHESALNALRYFRIFAAEKQAESKKVTQASQKRWKLF